MISRLIRSTHLYLALFLGPWVLLYAGSTFVMNHRAWFRGEPAPPPRWERLAEDRYPGGFPPGATAGQMAAQILAGLGMEGSNQASLRNGTLVITRNHAQRPLRVTYTVADRRLVVERQAWDGAMFLERMHRRRGFQSPYILEDAWAFSVDLFIVAVLFWSLSGFWLWWEMRPTRRAGLACLVAGIALFSIFLAVL